MKLRVLEQRAAVRWLEELVKAARIGESAHAQAVLDRIEAHESFVAEVGEGVKTAASHAALVAAIASAVHTLDEDTGVYLSPCEIKALEAELDWAGGGDE